MRAELLSVGTELLLGQIVDTNSAYLAGRLAALGIDLLHMSTVGDNLERAAEDVRRGLSRSELLIITGGLGPTEDDLTREAIAAAVGETPAVDPALERDLREWFAGRGFPMPERNRKQAWLIPSARALPNPLGTAPGWLVTGTGGRRIVAMPGVPREMTRMWEHEVEPVLWSGSALRSRTLKLLGIGESAVEEALDELVRSRAPTVATYAKADGVHVRITDKDADGGAAEARVAAMEARVRERLGRYVWGADLDTLPRVIGAGLAARGWTLATAEALTGGDLARILVDDGIGERYAGGIVRPGLGSAELLGAAPAADVAVAVAGDAEAARVVARVRGADRAVEIRARGLAEARRRGVLGALDVLRRAVAPD
ncbi:MAG TPA: CinA family nicotinamide mononucleotide deamidase-related protein [Candidatus Limnocylindria bacterium]|nr:CinA family nicotinamide mononucleotide deamidase-related protein [Candidatus Limnocylindria bacterium]